MSPLEWCEMHGVSDAQMRAEFLDYSVALFRVWNRRDQYGPKELKPRGNADRGDRRTRR